MKAIIIGGFLGSGKTTLLLRLAHALVGESPGNEKVKLVIIENEIGKIGIDDQILRRDGYQVENLFSGCVCCTLTNELTESLSYIRERYSPDYLIIEATGLARPGRIRELVHQVLDVPSRIVAVVDAKRWAMLSKAMDHLVPAQLEEANVILINKCDLISAQVLSETQTQIYEQFPNALVFSVSAIQEIKSEIMDCMIHSGGE